MGKHGGDSARVGAFNDVELDHSRDEELDRLAIAEMQRGTWYRYRTTIGVIICGTAFLIMVLVTVTGSTDQGATTMDAATVHILLDEIFEEYWAQQMTNHPETATYTADARFSDMNGKLSVLTEEQFAAEAAQMHALLERLAEVPLDGADEQDVLSAELFHVELQNSLDMMDTKFYLMPINQLEGVQLEFADLVNQFTEFNGVADYENLLLRYAAFPTYMEQTIALLREGVRTGMVPPRVTLASVQDQIDELLVVDETQSPFYTPFRTMASTVPAAKQDELRQRARPAVRKVLDAFHELGEYWPTYVAAARETFGVSALKNGAELYAFFVRYHTTTARTPAELHQTGLDEVARIQARMHEQIARTPQAGSSLEEFNHFLRTDSQFYFDTSEELMEHIRAVAKRADPELPKLFGVLPRCPFGVVEVPASAAPVAPAAYYNEPNEGCTRAGYYWVNTYNLPSRPKYLMESTTLHETVPGHHLQLAIQGELDLPLFRKHSGATSYIEGWALYSESLGETMGFYQTPYIRYGAYGDEILRACRLVIDTGLHAQGWTRQQAIDYMIDNTPLSELDSTSEVDRYMTWPGQALAYKVGQMTITALREQVRAKQGEAFDIRAFHDLVLGSGALPMSTLEKRVRSKYGL